MSLWATKCLRLYCTVDRGEWEREVTMQHIGQNIEMYTFQKKWRRSTVLYNNFTENCFSSCRPFFFLVFYFNNNEAAKQKLDVLLLHKSLFVSVQVSTQLLCVPTPELRREAVFKIKFHLSSQDVIQVSSGHKQQILTFSQEVCLIQDVHLFNICSRGLGKPAQHFWGPHQGDRTSSSSQTSTQKILQFMNVNYCCCLLAHEYTG